MPTIVCEGMCQDADKTPAAALVTWGNYPNGAHNTANLCQRCIDDLWAKLKPQVTAMVAHVRFEPPGNSNKG